MCFYETWKKWLPTWAFEIWRLWVTSAPLYEKIIFDLESCAIAQMKGLRWIALINRIITRALNWQKAICDYLEIKSANLNVWRSIRTRIINTLRPRQNGRHFPDDIFKWIFLNENVWISSKISLKFVPWGTINNIWALVQIMAWRRPSDKPLSEPMMVRLMTHICIIQPNELKRVAFLYIDEDISSQVYDTCMIDSWLKGTVLLTWMNSNPSMEKWSHPS